MLDQEKTGTYIAANSGNVSEQHRLEGGQIDQFIIVYYLSYGYNKNRRHPLRCAEMAGMRRDVGL